MFFIREKGTIYHILEDTERGAAPLPCGIKMERYELAMLARGKRPRNVVEEKPADAPLCKHCAKSLGAGS